MKKKIFYLSTCDTCKRIIDQLQLKEKGFELQDIKTSPITASELDALKEKAGSYEALFSKIARKYKELKLSEKTLSESDIKSFILNEYTFLKRPVILYNNSIFIGNSKNVILDAQKTIK